LTAALAVPAKTNTKARTKTIATIFLFIKQPP
jgi:hypothetical protein